MIDFADPQKCKKIFDLNFVSATELTETAQVEYHDELEKEGVERERLDRGQHNRQLGVPLPIGIPFPIW